MLQISQFVGTCISATLLNTRELLLTHAHIHTDGYRHVYLFKNLEEPTKNSPQTQTLSMTIVAPHQIYSVGWAKSGCNESLARFNAPWGMAPMIIRPRSPRPTWLPITVTWLFRYQESRGIARLQLNNQTSITSSVQIVMILTMTTYTGSSQHSATIHNTYRVNYCTRTHADQGRGQSRTFSC